MSTPQILSLVGGLFSLHSKRIGKPICMMARSDLHEKWHDIGGTHLSVQALHKVP